MSYERQRTVQDGDEVIYDGDVQGRQATRGPLLQATGPGKLAVPLRANEDGQAQVIDASADSMLRMILNELRIMNTHLACITGIVTSTPYENAFE
jgi:hypothetical protein